MRFEKWLTRPSSLRFLRSIINQQCSLQCPIIGPAQRRCHSISATYTPGELFTDRNATGLDELPKKLVEIVTPCQRQRSIQATRTSALKSNDPQRDIRLPPLYVPENIERETSNLANLLEEADQESGINGVRIAFTIFIDRGIAINQAGPSAEKVWGILLKHIAIESQDAASIRSGLFPYILRLNKATGKVPDGIYRAFVGQLLRHDPRTSQVRAYHIKFKHRRMFAAEDLIALVSDVLESKQPMAAFKQWQRLYLSESQRDIAAACMARMNADHALYNEFRQLFYHAGDKTYHGTLLLVAQQGEIETPRQTDRQANGSEPCAPFHQQIVSTTPSSESKANLSETTTVMAPASSTSKGTHYSPKEATVGFRLTRSAMSALLGEVHGISEKSLDGQFAARVLATKLLPLQAAITGLRILGIDKLDSIAIQEIVRRAGDAVTITSMLKHARLQGLHLIHSTYLSLLQDLTNSESDSAEGLQALLQSDQHPDNYDNVVLQNRLLVDFEHTQDWPNMVLTIKVLAIHGQNPPAFLWNSMLRMYSIRRDMAGVKQALEYMKLNNLSIVAITLSEVQRALLPERKVSMREKSVPGINEHRRLMAKIYMHCVDQGLKITASEWLELLKRFGMNHQIMHLNNVVSWLGRRYAQQMSASAKYTPYHDKYTAPQGARLPPFKFVFTANMQKAIVRWAWTAAGLHNRLKPRSRRHDACSWADGITTIKYLYDLGLPIDKVEVRVAIAQQLTVILGAGRSNRLINVALARNNKHSQRQYLRHLEAIWPDLMTMPRSQSKERDENAHIYEPSEDAFLENGSKQEQAYYSIASDPPI